MPEEVSAGINLYYCTRGGVFITENVLESYTLSAYDLIYDLIEYNAIYYKPLLYNCVLEINIVKKE